MSERQVTRVRIDLGLDGRFRYDYDTDDGTVVLHKNGFETYEDCVDAAWERIAGPVEIVVGEPS